ncbi:MAG TPA: DUF3108 domain-containing protein [Gemmatimonadota bacterium]|nr:DUF3108 domain-containing protein [Gemmatimonadota bacterium]
MRRRAAAGALAAALALAAAAGGLAAQDAAPDSGFAGCPFGVGERAEYAVTFGPVKVGRASLEAEAIDTVRGTPALRAALAMRGGTFFYRLDDRQVTWMAARPLRSLRFEQHLREGSYRRDRRYALDQDSGTYRRFDRARDGSWRPPPGDEHVAQGVAMPPAALDEIAFLYFARTLPLEPGKTYQFTRYFEADGNPVVLRVLGRETIRVPAGRFRTLVVRPIIKTGGLFGEGGRALIYFSDDERRVIVQLETSMSVGRLNMYLEDYRPPDADFAPLPCGG